MIAKGAEPILAARMKGYKPADMVAISLVGPLGLENPTVFAKPEDKYDWRWVRDLDVCLYLNGEQDWPMILKDIALQRPKHLSLWDQVAGWGASVYLVPTDRDIALPVKMWRYELDFTPWLDFQNEDFKTCKSYKTQ